MYDYETEKTWLLTDEGQRQFLATRDYILRVLSISGAIKINVLAGIVPDVCHATAFIDRMVELGELIEIVGGPNTWGKDRIFVKG